jgi:hypothetical protein
MSARWRDEIVDARSLTVRYFQRFQLSVIAAGLTRTRSGAAPIAPSDLLLLAQPHQQCVAPLSTLSQCSASDIVSEIQRFCRVV